ncbi:MAG: KamA family radical SAM protein [Myxococcota bacterium]
MNLPLTTPLLLRSRQTTSLQGCTIGVGERPRFKPYTLRTLDRIPQIDRMSEDQRFAMRVVGEVFPFRVNNYVVDELIDWDRIPDDPIFQLTFPQPGMLEPEHFDRIANLLRRGASRAELSATIRDVHETLNPHPAGQMDDNVPRLDGRRVSGLQHKYRETVLFFPKQGQTCHAFCTYCFRWAQFIGQDDLRIASDAGDDLHRYLARHPEVSDLLVTGGDPMVMRTTLLERYLDPLTKPELGHVQNVRIGTKALAYWPQRFVTDDDADGVLRLFERLVAAGKHVAVMTHFSHVREMHTPMVQEAIRRIQSTGAVLRGQSPIVSHVNDDAVVWSDLWREQVRQGVVPYYMFIPRDTGSRRYFGISLERAWQVFRGAYTGVSGLGRTVRGPSMSAAPGKVEVLGVTEVGGRKAFALRMLQGRNPAWVGLPFFAKYDPDAMWLDELEPLEGGRFFFEQDRESPRQV